MTKGTAPGEIGASPTSRSIIRSLLAEADFRRLLTAQFLAQAADGMAQAAFAEALILDPLTEANAAPGRILGLFALTLIPYSLIAPFMGVFVDRWQRRSLMVWTNLARAALLVTLPAWSDALPGDSGLYAGALALLGLGRLFLVTKGAVLPAILHEHNLLRGNAISSGGGMISALAGGAAGVGAVGLIDTDLVFVLVGVAYAASSLIATTISAPLGHAPRDQGERLGAAVARVTRDLTEGVRVVWARTHARISLIGIFVLRSIGMFTAIAAILVIKLEFPEAGDRFGRLSAAALALGAAGAGAFVGATTAPMLGRRLAKPGLILLGFFVSGVVIVLLGGIVNIPALLVLTFFGGFGGFVTKVAVDAQVQEALPDEYRGRAFSIYDILYNLASVAAALAMYLFQDARFRLLLIMAGLFALVAGALLAAAMRRAGMKPMQTPAE
ncbi:MAG: MFS transporter [Actinomycetota bacterium]